MQENDGSHHYNEIKTQQKTQNTALSSWQKIMYFSQD